MTQLEFTQRTGIVLTEDEYKEIEIMYMESGDSIDKDAFCQDYQKHHDSVLLKTFYRQSDKLKDKVDFLRREKSDTIDFLLERAQEFGDIKLLERAILLAGHDSVIKRKIRMNLPFWEMDLEYIKNNIK